MRSFNRFYTQQIGVLEEGLLRTPYPLPEARVLWEMGGRGATTATELRRQLDLDPGYLSRLLRRLERRGVVAGSRSTDDGRQRLLALTPSGESAFAELDAASAEQIDELLGRLSEADQTRLVEAMHTIESLLHPPAEPRAPFLLRPPRPGDMGWVISRHGALYSQEYQWDETFEALVAKIVAAYVECYDPRRERCWIAERRGEPVGSVFLVRASDDVAKLRLLLLEPHARGLGIGAALVAECVATARLLGYRRMTLWTQSVLLAARHIYQRVGFQLVCEEPSHAFGHDLISETWELDLSSGEAVVTAPSSSPSA
ncbi:MAG TPA: helix-turn-helix domain-containing GNAT family N-acetyltransferase [Thermoanaerobaculia bacterium]|nr:helix-turn-helix domain-containing GNAT family N-acetyltransferase [Thermoanaerobaculia bacterium]